MKSTLNKTSVIIIDDHALTRLGLKNTLEVNNDINLLAEAENFQKGMELIKKNCPDIVIINLDPPCSNNIKAIEQIKAFDENIKILILATSNSEEEVIESLRLGACAYCMKGITPEKIIQIVNFIKEGALWFDPLIANNIKSILLQKKYCKNNVFENEKVNNNKPQLTERELDVLRLIVDGYSNAEISEKLCVSIHTSKAHVCNILHKLSVDDRTQAAIKALKDEII